MNQAQDNETMEALRETLLSTYQVRKTTAQKRAFETFVQAYAKTLGLSMQVEESRRLFRTRSLIFGDAAQARTLLTAHYDTCARMPFPNAMTPLCWPLIILTQLLLMLALILPGILLGMVLEMTLHQHAVSIFAGVLAVEAMAALVLIGPANPHTANDNTSGVLTVLLAMAAFAQRKDVAYILFDNEELGLLGSSAYAGAHQAQMRRTFLVQLDCVGDGDTLLYTGSRSGMNSTQGRSMAQALMQCAPAWGSKPCTGIFPKVFYPSDQMAFARGTAFAALRGKRLMYLNRIHTARDTVLDLRNIRCLLSVFTRYLALEDGMTETEKSI